MNRHRERLTTMHFDDATAHEPAQGRSAEPPVCG